MGSTNKTFYVVMPVYNAEHIVERAVRSALSQRGVRVHLIIVDHGSTDRTVETVTPYIAGGRVSLLRLVRAPAEKRSASRPLGEGTRHVLQLAEANSECSWFVRLDADDVFRSNNVLEELMLHMARARLVIARLVFFDLERGFAETYGAGPDMFDRRGLLQGKAYSVAHHATAIRADLLSEVLQRRGYTFDHSIGYGEDFELMIALIKACTADEISFSDSIVCYKRLDGSTISRTSSFLSIARDHFRILRRHRLLFGELSFRVAADLLLQAMGAAESPLRIRLGYPGRRYAAVRPYDMDRVSDRLIALQSGSETSVEWLK